MQDPDLRPSVRSYLPSKAEEELDRSERRGTPVAAAEAVDPVRPVLTELLPPSQVERPASVEQPASQAATDQEVRTRRSRQEVRNTVEAAVAEPRRLRLPTVEAHCTEAQAEAQAEDTARLRQHGQPVQADLNTPRWQVRVVRRVRAAAHLLQVRTEPTATSSTLEQRAEAEADPMVLHQRTARTEATAAPTETEAVVVALAVVPAQVQQPVGPAATEPTARCW